MPAIEVRDLKKHYGSTKAVDGISFHVEQGEIFGMLGPNGAGKTTTVEIVEGLREPDAGQVHVLGLDVQRHPQAVKSRIGVQLQTTALYPRLTVREVLELFRTFFPGQTRTAGELIALVNLEEKEDTLSKDLSGGQRQRLSVALALVNQPEIVFLDEPTTGLDPQARRSMWDTIRSIRQNGATVFLTTHYMEEAQLLCHRVAVMDMGHIIALDSPGRLISQHFAETAVEFEDLMDMPAQGTFSTLPGVTRSQRDSATVTLFTTDTTATLGALTRLAEAGTIHFDALHVRRATLEDVFLKLTGRRIRD
ncbi:MAG: ABC transporter ATP-binding protein [Chloroflexi bacterium]|nr:ABC transporter ATP-binding protein [Chloroflexota bacterium]MCI0577490.1 ABC transporter ATP-binding protein [Chloroflexota bacterium]MCI0647681.1 ABC transporter ATP-binding protein [Chloroflexota bacterium]MCI0730111.1 ABC transporter ATP-binding protein [Chloroflexota bacterium]